MWGFAQWAYQRELVRFAGSGERAGGGRAIEVSTISQTGIVCRILELGATILGGGRAIHGGYEAHPEAAELHALVASWPTADYWRFVDAAESGRPPAWNPELPAARYVPVLRRGKPEVVSCATGRRGLYCPVIQVGYTREEAEAARSAARVGYARWVACLEDAMREMRAGGSLKRWRIMGLGVPVAPWGEADEMRLSTDVAA